jgi:hypothetical protein
VSADRVENCLTACASQFVSTLKWQVIQSFPETEGAGDVEPGIDSSKMPLYYRSEGIAG